MRRLAFLSVLSFLIGLATVGPARPAPTFIPIQAVVQNTAGTPVNGTRSVTFLLYEAQNDISPFWSETQTVNIVKGQLTTVLGKVTPIPLPLTGGAYLGIRVASDPEMTPRLTIGAAPFALGLPNVFTTTIGNIGIGTIHPAYALDILDDQAVTRLTSTTSSAGSVLELRNDATPYSSLGSLDYSYKGVKHGAVSYALAGNSNDGLAFTAGAAERARLTASGRLGLGTNSPAYPLDILSAGQGVIRLRSQLAGYGSVLELRNDTGYATLVGAVNFVTKDGAVAGQVTYSAGHTMSFNTNGTGRMTIDDVGKVGIGVAPAYPLDVQGDINARGSVRANGVVLTSDARYKDHIAPIPDGLDTVLALRGVTFDWKRAAYPDKGFPQGRQVGFVAQEVEKVLPQVVETGPDGSKAVAYQNIVPVLVEAIKAQQREIEEKDATLKDVQARLDRLERLVQRGKQ